MNGSQAANLLKALFVSLVVCAAYAVKYIPSYAGPYRIILKQIMNLTGEDAGTQQFWMKMYVQSYRPGHPQFLHGRVVNTVPLTDDYQSLTYLDVRSNNEWKRNAFVIKLPHLCSTFDKHAPSEKKIFFGEDAKFCPIPAGDRIVKNQTIILEYPYFPVLPYGRFLYRSLVLDKKGKSIGGAAFDFEFVPKVT